MAATEPEPVFVFRSNTTPVHCVAFDPRGLLLASGNEAGDVFIWNVSTKRSVRIGQPAHTGSVLTVAFVDEHRRLITHGRDHQLRLWQLSDYGEDDLAFESATAEMVSSIGVNSLNFCRASLLQNPSSKALQSLGLADQSSVCIVAVVSATNEAAVDILDLCQSQRIKASIGTAAPITVGPQNTGMCMAIKLFEHDNELQIVIGYESGAVALWNVVTGQLVAAIHLHTEPVLCLAIDFSAGRLFSGAPDRQLGIALITKDSLVAQLGLVLPSVGIADMAVRHDGKLLAIAGWDSKVRLFAAKSQRALAVLSFHRDTVNSVAFAPQGNLMAAASKDTRISLWSLY